MSFKVVKAGFLACIQDRGRFNHGVYGMAQSGVMDEHAYAWANHLLNNCTNDAVLEITFGALQLVALDNMNVALTGANLDFKINNTTAPMWHSLQINQGDILSWGGAKNGIRAYLAVTGGFDTPVLFGSRSVNLRENIGSKIAVNDVLSCSPLQPSKQNNNRFTSPQYLPDYTQDINLRLLPSYQFNNFSISQRDLFFNQTYTVSNASDRTGCRLNGAPIAIKNPQMVSEGISYGSVEIVNDGLPIILLKDAPTIGGYPKVGTVFSLDLAKLAQTQATANIRFKLITISEAQQQRQQFNAFFKIQ